MQEKTGITIMIVSLLIGSLGGWVLRGSTNPQPNWQGNSESLTEVNLDQFWDVWGRIEGTYFDHNELTEDQLVFGAIDGLVDSLGDPHSDYLSPEEAEQFTSGINGAFEGIGAELTVENGQVMVVTPLKDSPASKAGLLPKDIILSVDGEPILDLPLWEVIMMIRGERGTEVVLTVFREGEEDALDIAITRQTIDLPSLELTFQEQDGQKIAKLALYRFGEDTLPEFNQAVRDIMLENANGMVLDLRQNPGGLLSASVDIIGTFFKEPMKAVVLKSRGNEDEITYTQGNGKLPNIPLAVLISPSSASASEILAGALQDHERATILGQQSFGKGSVQQPEEFTDGSLKCKQPLSCF